jgi:hypothetical protein
MSDEVLLVWRRCQKNYDHESEIKVNGANWVKLYPQVDNMCFNDSLSFERVLHLCHPKFVD